jgi:hypothetical protein
MSTVLILGSAPMAARAAQWPRAPFDRIVAINNAHALRPDWDFHIHPWDFPADRLPNPGPGQCIITETDFVPAQNAWGGFVYAGGTMAFTAAYWALHALRPRVIALFGCDMHYPKAGPTHFYGTGTPDPLRPDITLRSLEAKSARLQVLAALAGTAVVNLSTGPSRLVLPRVRPEQADSARPAPVDHGYAMAARAAEARLDYVVPSGRYWEAQDSFDPAALDAVDQLWLAAAGQSDARASA